MAVEYQYNSKLKLLTVMAKGHATVEEIELCMEEFLTSNDIPSDVNCLWDVRGLQFDHIDIEFIKRFIVLRKKHDDMRGKAKIAILSNSLLAAPLIKLYTILSKDLRQSTRTFKVNAEAELWLCEDWL